MRETNNLPILLVGASGRVGQMIAYHWCQFLDHLPLMLQLRQQGSLQHALIWDPLAGSDALLQFASKSGGFRAMVVLAGVTPGSDKDLDLNRTLAQACLDAAAKTGTRRVLLASSSAVYGAGGGMALHETAPCAPVNEYGAAKLRMELASAPWRENGMDLCFLRIGNVAGADALLLNVANAIPGETIEIDVFDDGRGPVRSYIGGRTLAEVIRSLCLHPTPLPAVLNIGAPQPVSMDALADAAGQPWRARAAPSASVQTITMDCSLLASLHSFRIQDSDPAEMVQQWREST